MTNKDKLYIHNRRYLGSKYRLLPFIEDIVKKECGKFYTFTDLFAGTGVVAYFFNKPDNKTIVNDILYSNYLFYVTWLGNGDYDEEKIKKIIKEFNNIKLTKENYVSKNFGDRYFSIENARKIGIIREEIKFLAPTLTFREEAILITSLLYALDRIANTCGHYDTFRKRVDDNEKLILKTPFIQDEYNKNNEIYREDANKLVKHISTDIVYIDTPYNSRQYSDTYHLLENIAEWKKPEVEGKAKKMVDRSHIKSKYCTVEAPKVFDELIQNIDAKYILVSYSNMGKKGDGRSNAKISDEELMSSLEKRGKVKIFEQEYNYYTTGRRELEDYRERLFLCRCKG